MSIARAWALVGGLAWVVASCTPAPTFQCKDDGDCILAGDNGQCQPSGSCAYTDDDCESGLSYPAGAPPDLAGRCIDGPAASDETGGVSSSSGGGGDSSTDGPSPSTGSVAETGDSSTSTPPPMTGTADGPGSGTGPTCAEDVEPDDRKSAEQEVECGGGLMGELQHEGDRDWFHIAPCGAQNFSVTLDAASEGVQACLVLSCLNGEPANPKCGEGTMWEERDGEFQGCCGVSSFSVSAQCPDESQLFVLARTNPDLGGGESCASYVIDVSPG